MPFGGWIRRAGHLQPLPPGSGIITITFPDGPRPDGATTEAWLQAGESYAFTAAASIRAVEETLTRSASGAVSPAAAFGADFAPTSPGTTRLPAEVPRIPDFVPVV
jgi:hypothetical protein